MNEGELPAAEPALAAAARTILFASAAALAVAAPLVHGAQAAGIPFGTVALLVGLLCPAAAGWILIRGFRGLGEGLRAERRDALVLALVCAAAGALPLLVQHVTSDDSTYLPPVVACLAHPDRPPGSLDFLWGNEAPAPHLRWMQAVPFDFALGVVSRWTSIPLLVLRYLVSAPLLAALVPLTWFVLLGRFGIPSRHALAGLVAGGAGILLMRETERAPLAVHSLLVFQGKFAAIAILLPLFAATAVDFLRAPDARGWGRLLVVATAAGGCDLSSVVLVSLLAGLLALAGATSPRPGRLGAALLLVASVAYPLLVGACAYGDAVADLTGGATLIPGASRSWRSHIPAVLGGACTAPLLAAGLLAAVALLRGESRRFALAWAAAAGLLLLNPLVAPFVMDHVTSADVYWRTGYLLPVPLLVALPGAWLSSRAEAGGWRSPTLPATLLAGALLLAQVPAWKAGLGRSLELAYPRLDPDRCLGVEPAADARWLAGHAPPGPFLGPLYLSTLLPMMAPDRPVLVHWSLSLRIATRDAVAPDEFRLRQWAARCLLTGSDLQAGALREVLRRHPSVRSVATAPPPEAVAGILRDAGFERAAVAPSGLHLFVRRGK